jgi:hypothetical protein
MNIFEHLSSLYEPLHLEWVVTYRWLILLVLLLVCLITKVIVLGQEEEYGWTTYFVGWQFIFHAVVAMFGFDFLTGRTSIVGINFGDVSPGPLLIPLLACLAFMQAFMYVIAFTVTFDE